MIQEHINLLTLKEYFLIISDITGKPYIDKDYGCYMFEVKSDAKAFTDGIENTSFDDARTYKQMTFCTEFYSYGISTIHVKSRANEEFVDIPVEKEDAKKQFFNPEAHRMILRLQQTKQKQYLRGMGRLKFISPVLLDARLPKQYPGIHYSYATITQSDKYYILFSTIQELKQWNEEQENKWNSLEVTLETFGRVRKENPVFINPLSNKLILNDKQIAIATEGENA